MTSMTKLRRRLDRWARFADKVTPGWSRKSSFATKAGEAPPLTCHPPAGLVRAWDRHDREQLRRNVLLWS